MMTSTRSTATTTKRKYDELKIDGPPLFCNNIFATTAVVATPQQKKSSSSSSSSTGNTTNVILTAPPPPIDASKTALLVVDVQPEYWSEWYVVYLKCILLLLLHIPFLLPISICIYIYFFHTHMVYLLTKSILCCTTLYINAQKQPTSPT